MNTPILTIDQWDDRAAIAQVFHARMPSMPVYASGTQCFFTNPFEGVHGDASRWRHNNHGDLRIEPDNWEFHPDKLVMKVQPMDPITMPEGQLSFKGAALVSNFFLQEGTIIIDARFSGALDIAEAIWLMTVPHYRNGEQEVNNPEYDPWETGTPGHREKMSKSVIHSYAPMRATDVQKIPLSDFAGKRHQFVIRILEKRISCASSAQDYWCVKRPQPRLPVYLIIWIAVQKHQPIISQRAALELYSVKLYPNA